MSDTVQLDLVVLLPQVPDAEDRCVERLAASLEGLNGVERVHVAPSEGAFGRLCVHYDRGHVALDEVRRVAQREGARLTDSIGHVVWSADGIGHERRARTLGERLLTVDGVLGAAASSAGVVRIEYDRARVHVDALADTMGHMGVRVRRANGASSADESQQPHAHGSNGAAPESSHDHDHGEEHGHEHGGGHDHSHGGVFGERTELYFAIASGVAYLAGVLISWLTDLPHGVSIVFYLAAYGLGGFFTVREAFDSIRAGRFEVDFLMLVAAVGAAALGKWAEGAVLLFLFSLGHALEHYAMGRARRAIEALAGLTPKTALVRRGAIDEEVPVEQLQVGDIVLVRPNARLAADGVVVSGQSDVDQAPVTGESIPVDKRPIEDMQRALKDPDRVDAASRVFAGTINGSGVLEIAVTRRSEDNTLARMVRLVQEAETQRSPTQRFTDRFERIFVPAVLAFVGLLLFAWVVVDEPFSDSFYRAMAVLVASSPCALAISTPSAVLSGVARAARSGVLIKGGGPLENLGAVTAIAFDKTGTLTNGRPELTDVITAEGVQESELLAVAVAIERLSDHPLAGAVVRDGTSHLGDGEPVRATDLRAIVGRGVEARIDGEPAYLGSLALFDDLADGAKPSDAMREAVGSLSAQGRTTMVLRRGQRYLGVLGLMDTPRPEAGTVITQLRALGIRRTVMISGDNQRVADAVAAQVGVSDAWGDLLPQDKVDAIRRLDEQEGRTAMVGDGVNDAPAMAYATVGIAMGAAGSDVALEAADVALMADDLEKLPFVTSLSRRASAVIRQNLFLSLGVVVLLVPATVLGLGIGPAVAVHEGSTLIVVFNALRLLGYRDKVRKGLK